MAVHVEVGAVLSSQLTERSVSTQRVDEPVHAAPPLAASVVRVYSCWPTAVHVDVAAVLSSQLTGNGTAYAMEQH